MNSGKATNNIDVDIALIGGGIAGLWLLNSLRNLGYNAILFEQDQLGSFQTVASQGMIHGGVKYTLGGALTGSSEAIAEMPDYWKRCLAGQGDIDLSHTRCLSEFFYMWSTASSLSKATTFIASKALRGRVDALKQNEYPELFRNPGFRGSVYKLVDVVIDTPSLINNLASLQRDRIFKIDWNEARLGNNNGEVYLQLPLSGETTLIHAKQFVLTAGAGNEQLLQQIDAEKPVMQRRPLKQVLVKHDYAAPLYAHCIGTDSTPRLTISSHPCRDGQWCWYLGGQLAEHGAQQSDDELIETARKEIADLFPWLDWTTSQWAAFSIDRAEPRQKGLVRPDNAFIDQAVGTSCAINNVMVAWPTKLTLVPDLALRLKQQLQKNNILAGPESLPDQLNNLPRPEIASTPWDTLFD
jgi:glycerol-3-phosphate dehydrogenase